jgi:hypothetical protein
MNKPRQLNSKSRNPKDWEINGPWAVFSLFAVDDDLKWTNHPENFNGLWRKTTYDELKDAVGTTSDEDITELIRRLDEHGIISARYVVKAGAILQHILLRLNIGEFIKFSERGERLRQKRF